MDYKNNMSISGSVNFDKKTGIADGYETGNLNKSINSTSSYVAVFKFAINEFPADNTTLFYVARLVGTQSERRLRINYNSNGIILQQYQYGAIPDTQSYTSDYTLSADVDYWVKLEYAGTNSTVSVSTNGEDYTQIITAPSITTNVGYVYLATKNFNGCFYLPQCQISSKSYPDDIFVCAELYTAFYLANNGGNNGT